MKYFFILGHNPILSFAEIQSLIVRILSPMTTNILELSEEVLILETENKIDVQKLQKELGGTIKIGKILRRIDAELTQINPDIFLKELLKEFDSLGGQTFKKVYFSFSVYKLNQSVDVKKFIPRIRKLAMEIKKRLKNQGISSRWVSSRERKLSSVIVRKNKLLTQGAEFCLFLTRTDTDRTRTDTDKFLRKSVLSQYESVLVGKTLTCQEFEEYEFYDFVRPKRPIKQGMLPPKLAKIMINLAQVPKNGVILDPFCGSGTILQEAVRLGYNNLIGTDIDERAISSAKTNLEWLAAKLKTQIKNVKIFKCDVRNLSEKIPKNSVDAIITEPYLGPLKIENWKLKIKSLVKELSNLYLSAFQEFKKVLKLNNSRVVIIFPVFKRSLNSRKLGPNDIYVSEKILETIKQMGFQVAAPIPENLKNHPVVKLTPRDSIIYFRPDQHVLREIFIFIRNPFFKIEKN